MKIWIVEIGEPLPFEENVRLHRYGQFSRYLAARGHHVTWWTSTFSHAPKAHIVPDETDRECQGVHMKFVQGLGYPRNVSLERFRHQSDFADKFFARAQQESELPDLIIAPIPTLEGASRAVEFGLSKNIPVVTDIRDQWPDEFVNLAPKPFRPLVRPFFASMYKKANFICSQAAGIMGMSYNELNYGLRMAQREQDERDCFFPLGYSLDKPEQDKINQAYRWASEQGIDSQKFVICFFGTIGRFFNLKTVIDAARKLQGENVQFVLAGSGSQLESFKRQAKGLSNVIFPGWIDAPKIHAVMGLSKAGIAPYNKDAVMSFPNKPFEYMAGSLPILSSIQGQLKKVLSDHYCGLTYFSDDTETLVKHILWLKNNPDEARNMGRKGRQLLESEYSTEKVFQRVEKHLEKICHR